MRTTAANRKRFASANHRQGDDGEEMPRRQDGDQEEKERTGDQATTLAEGGKGVGGVPLLGEDRNDRNAEQRDAYTVKQMEPEVGGHQSARPQAPEQRG